ncbi:hypothetical protein CcI49_14465 [Frankia sp. CcI49]|uniref:ABC transporter permease n=1 Tax=Frankia sp. CcI49 TaxID=1745382 RepID=UPI0009777064|nr:ABC transporter permease [Frankia sp. CcI49]ONH59916.1 hypothetical protein CcI49_14465 [Frankia sp. CcI49]
MAAVGRVVRSGVARRRVQTAVMVLTVVTAVSASVLAAGLLVASRAPFDRAFARQAGAHLTARFDAGAVHTDTLAATRSLPGVAAAAGPFRTLSTRPTAVTLPDGGSLNIPDGQLPLLTLVGRSAADATGQVDKVILVDGRWPTGPGEIVLDAGASLPPLTGLKLTFADLPGAPDLTVVGRGRSMTHSASGWVTPDQLTALAQAPESAGYQMLYRLTAAATEAEVQAGRDAISAALPAGTMTGSQSYLPVRRSALADTTVYVPFVAAFGLLALAMSALIIGIVVSGAVGASTWRIGVLKALGFTPVQVVRAYVGQALVPSAVGTGLGLLLGNLAAVPILHQQASAYQVGAQTIAPWVDIAVAGWVLLLVGLAALLASARAGRLRAMDAIAVGRAPRAGRGQLAQRLTGRLPLPRPIALGLAAPFAHPARSAVLAAAVCLGVVGATFAVGLGATLTRLTEDNGADGRGDVLIDMGGMLAAGDGVAAVETRGKPGNQAGPAGGAGGGSPVGGGPVNGGGPAQEPDPRAAAAAISAAPGTERFYGTAETELSAPAIAGPLQVTAYDGDASWASLPMISGRWFGGPGEAVVDTRFLRAANTEVGGTVTLDGGGRTVTLRIVGEFFDLHADTIDLRTDMGSLPSLGLGLAPSRFDVDLRPGTDAVQYLARLRPDLEAAGAMGQTNEPAPGSTIIIMKSLITMLTLMIAAVAVLGVLDTVVLDVRRRVRDFGILKALGMTPRQTMVVIVTSVAGIGLLAGFVGVPTGIALHHFVVPRMGATGGTSVPARYLDVLRLPEQLGLLAGGLVIAVAGALAPAGWAAGSRTATALRSE